MIKVVFDLDEVIRLLLDYISDNSDVPFPQNWDWKYKGKDIFDLVKDMEYRPLTESRPSPILDFVNNSPLLIEPVEIWTAQPKDWMNLSIAWIEKYITRPHTTLIFESVKNKEYVLYAKDGTYLVDDSPVFDNYDRILLVDKPYNQHIKASRIHSVRDLDLSIRLLNATH